MKKILAVAFRNGIAPDYAQKLAKERLAIVLLESGLYLPTLTIQVLGRLTVSFDGKICLEDHQLTPAQRQLLALLISTPGLKINQEDIQLTFWPDSPPAKARSKLDNLISRLRKIMDENLLPYTGRDYLMVEKGVVFLQHCTIDAVEFERFAQQGIKYAQQKKFWQAHNSLWSAIRFWQDEFLAGHFAGELMVRFQDKLNMLYQQAIITLLPILIHRGQEVEAIQLAEKGHGYFQTNRDIVKLLYDLYNQQKNSSKAGKLIKRYKQSLQVEGFSSSEIEEILNSLWSIGE